ncbi:MAG TPA: ABC transporter ATP-binding protein [Drouetiella sp.]
MSTAISAVDLTKEFASGRVKALNKLTLSIEPGEIFGIIGPNGAGKTTFMSCLLGALYPTSGTLLIDGKNPDDIEVHRWLGYLPERLEFTKWMTGMELMKFHAGLLNQPAKTPDTKIEQLLERVQLDRPAWTRKIKNYSRGMLQRVGMAQALLGEPRLLLLDEPSSGLDPVGVKLFQQLLREEKAKGTTIVINSHQLDQLEKICDRVAFIKSGIVQTLEVMKDTVARDGLLALKWSLEANEKVTSELVEKAVADAGATVQTFEFPTALVNISGEEMSARVISNLALAGVAPAQAFPNEGRLESIFLQSATSDSRGTP